MLATKLWWRWIKSPASLWAKLWKLKYPPLTPFQSLIYENSNCTGSVIWKNAWKNQSLVHAHFFWEVHDGNSALFWEDTWEQLPILGGGDCFLTLRNALRRARWDKLHHFWKTKPLLESTFMRTWKPLEKWSVQWTKDIKLSISRNLQERQIEIRTREYIIHWGPQGNVQFGSQTTYQLLQDSGCQQNKPIWRKIWSDSL